MCPINYMEYGNKEEKMDIASPQSFHVKPPPAMDYTNISTSASTTIKNSALQLFSKIYEAYLWIFRMKWYKILLITIAGMVIYVFIDSALEYRKESKRTKEGMQSIKKKDTKMTRKENKKKVTFDLDEPPTYLPIYDLVVKPTVYSISRNLGFR